MRVENVGIKISHSWFVPFLKITVYDYMYIFTEERSENEAAAAASAAASGFISSCCGLPNRLIDLRLVQHCFPMVREGGQPELLIWERPPPPPHPAGAAATAAATIIKRGTGAATASSIVRPYITLSICSSCINDVFETQNISRARFLNSVLTYGCL